MKSFTNMGHDHGVVDQLQANKIVYSPHYTAEGLAQSKKEETPEPKAKPKAKRQPRKKAAPKTADSEKLMEAQKKDLRTKGIKTND